MLIWHGTFIGGGCDIYDNDFHELQPNDMETHRGNISFVLLVIGSHAFIGGHFIILKGVHISEGAVIGAGSVVTMDFPPYQIWAGCPARFVKNCPNPKRKK